MNTPNIKHQLRRRVYDARSAQPDKEAVSRVICDRFLTLPSYQKAKTVMWYLHCRSEVRTRETVERQMEQDKRMVVPYCTQDAEGQAILGLWHLQDFNELVPGMWGIMEPPRERWGEPGKEVDPKQLDLIMVPGVAFDRSGGRLGNGAGYYDRLLCQVRSDCVKAAVCFEAQLVAEVAMESYDVYMDYVITEKTIYPAVAR